MCVKWVITRESVATSPSLNVDTRCAILCEGKFFIFFIIISLFYIIINMWKEGHLSDSWQEPYFQFSSSEFIYTIYKGILSELLSTEAYHIRVLLTNGLAVSEVLWIFYGLWWFSRIHNIFKNYDRNEMEGGSVRYFLFQICWYVILPEMASNVSLT